MGEQKLVVFDCETSGLDPQKHAIIQIAAVAVDEQFRELEAFERKILFLVENAEPEALKLNSYDAAIWEREALAPARVAAEFASFLGRHATVELISKRSGRPYQVARLAGHNAASFDGEFLKAWYRRLGAFLPAEYLIRDTLQLALWRFHGAVEKPASFKLADLCAYFGIELGADAHDALADVRATAQLAARLTNARADEAA